MGYFSECAIDYAKAASYERVDYSYPTKQETLNYYFCLLYTSDAADE